MKEIVLTHSSVALPSGRDSYKLNRRLICLQGWDGDFGEESTLLHIQQLALSFPADSLPATRAGLSRATDDSSFTN